MPDGITCPAEGCAHPPFKTPQALQSHIRSMHPELEPEKESSNTVPIVEDDFAKLLIKFKIKVDLAHNIAENVSHTGGARVFEEPEILMKRLSLWSSDIPPAKRGNIIAQWFAERGVDIPPEIQKRAGMTTEQIQETEKTTKEAGVVSYVYDTDVQKVRMAKEGEKGGTLTQAKELKKMAEEDENTSKESPFMQDAEGHWVLNPKARVSGVELMAFQFMKQSQEKGEPIDPITAMTQAADRWKTLREGLGVGNSTLPTWMTDPAAFVTMVQNISGGKGEDSALKTALAAMQKTVDEMKEERFRTQLEAQQRQIQDVTGVLNKTLEAIADMKRERVGRTEMDILDKIATEGIGLARTELPGLRRDIKDALSSVVPSPGKTAEQREERKNKFKKAIDDDGEIENIGKRLFFPES